jgi:CRP-like cAMP-binding protein
MYDTEHKDINNRNILIFILFMEIMNNKVALSPIKEQNHLFKAIPAAEWEKILPYIEAVDLPAKTILSAANINQNYVYFPSTAVVSIMHDLQEGTSAEVAVIGLEGLVGVCIFMGGESSSSVAMVKIAGAGYRIKTSLILEEFNQSKLLQNLILRFTQALITQITHTAVCNRHHRIEQQLSRTLLISLDRLQGNEIKITQEMIANLMGVRREGITEAALKLQASSLIKYSRGRITVLDRIGLEHQCCECYHVVTKEYARLMPTVQARMAI